MPALAPERMTEAQREAAAELAAGPRGGVRGPFVALLRSPELMRRLQRVGEYLRFGSRLEPRLGELAVLITARRWTQQFEWAVHRPLALAAGLPAAVADALAEGRRPSAMTEDEALVHDVCEELFRTHGLSDASYARAVARLGEDGLVDLLGLLGYFTTVSMVLNVARTPPPAGAEAAPLPSWPL
jgi:4-carboxymuconolactone decarboxylase